MWEHERRCLANHGLSWAEWAVLITAAYYIPLPEDKFIPLAAWESQGNASETEVYNGFYNCLNQGWIRFTSQGHIERERDVFGELTGEVTEYPERGVVLTESGFALHSRTAIAIFGPEYFRKPPMKFE